MQVRHPIVPFNNGREAKGEDDVVPDHEQLRFPEPEEAAMQEDLEIQPLAPAQVDNEVDRLRGTYHNEYIQTEIHLLFYAPPQKPTMQSSTTE